MAPATDVGAVSIRDVRRIAALARVHGEPYLAQLIAIASYAVDEAVRRLAYEELYRASR